MKNFNIIVAIDSKNGIGKDGIMPWTLPSDMKHFKEITCRQPNPIKKNIVIMGRKTWDSIPPKFKPLKGRINFILTRNKLLVFSKDVLVSDSFEKTFNMIDSLKDAGDIFVIGGSEIFKIALKNPYCKKLYITHIIREFDCDTFFPSFTDDFVLEKDSGILEDNYLKYHFSEYVRKESDKFSLKN